MIDSHCHLADPTFNADIAPVLARAQAAGVTASICIADSLPEAERCIALSDHYENLFATAGVHPHNAKEWTAESEAQLRHLLASSPKVRAVGEIGLDYHYDFSPREMQIEVFRAQLEIAKELRFPVVVHCREAVTDIVKILEEIRPEKLVLHCCSERFEDVQHLVERGYLLSFTGIATYASAGEMRRTIQLCPLSQCMIETDAPYLAPIPHRGRRNEPAFVVEVVRAIAKIKGLPLEEIASATTKNAIEFYGLPATAGHQVPVG